MRKKADSLRCIDFCFATLGAAVFAGCAFLLCLWIEHLLFQGETGMGRLGIALLMIGPKFILPIFLGAVGIAFGCAWAQKLFPQDEGAKRDANSI